MSTKATSVYDIPAIVITAPLIPVIVDGLIVKELVISPDGCGIPLTSTTVS